MPSDASVLLPIGQDLGRTPTGRSGTDSNGIRVGRTYLNLPDPYYAAWLYAHGATKSDGTWTEEEFIRFLENSETEFPEEIVRILRTWGLIEVVQPVSPSAVEFARSHRVQPLMLGLGRTPEDDGTFQIGLYGRPVLSVTSRMYALWADAPNEPTLWDLCRSVARLLSAEGGDGEQPVDPHSLLSEFLLTATQLCLTSSLYIDTVDADGAPLQGAAP